MIICKSSFENLTSNTQNGLGIRHNDQVDGVSSMLLVICNIGCSIDISQMRLELRSHTILVGEGLRGLVRGFRLLSSMTHDEASNLISR